MDYEYTSKTAPTGDSQATDLGRLSGVSTRRASAVANGATTMAATNSSGSASSKDHIPGTSSFSANPTNAGPSQSKKRKAAGSVNAAPSPNGPTAGSHAMTRKASTAAASAGGVRESNMLTFENCQGYLKNGKLKADDGTVLAVNGR
jgi:hypothetical protein